MDLAVRLLALSASYSNSTFQGRALQQPAAPVPAPIAAVPTRPVSSPVRPTAPVPTPTVSAPVAPPQLPPWTYPQASPAGPVASPVTPVAPSPVRPAAPLPTPTVSAPLAPQPPQLAPWSYPVASPSHPSFSVPNLEAEIEKEFEDDSLAVGAVIGIIFGVFITSCIFLVAFCMFRKKEQTKHVAKVNQAEGGII